MTENRESFTYHSLHRHVQSILPQSENKQFQTIYSSNKQPQLPSILSRSRQKKSHQKSLKKGISRVSKSKKDLYENTGQFQTKQVDTGKSLLSKGTLLNFNLQQVVENKYHLTKPREQLLNKSPLYTKIGKQQQKLQKSSYENEANRSFISEYRIVTYVPPGYMQQKNLYEQKKSQTLPGISKQLFRDKQNNLNSSNVQQRGLHKKNDSQQIQITNPIEENNFELNTWRTSQQNNINNNNSNNSNSNDPYYSSNLKQQLTKMNTMRNNNYEDEQNNVSTLYVPFQQRYSIPLTINVEEIVQQTRVKKQQDGRYQQQQQHQRQQQQLKLKIQHLQHQIIDIQREKGLLYKENNKLKEENHNLIIDNKKMHEQLQSLYPTIGKLQQKVKLQQQEIRGYKYSNNNISNNNSKKLLSQSQLYQQQQQQSQQQINSPYFFNQKQHDQHNNKIILITTRLQQLQLMNATLSKQLSQKSLVIMQLSGKNGQLMGRLREMERELTEVREWRSTNQQQQEHKFQQHLQQHLQQQSHTQPQPNHHNHDYYQQSHKQLSDDFEQLKQRYQQKIRDYNYLEKKHNFMKDQLQHLKYMESNNNMSNNNNNSDQTQRMKVQKQQHQQQQDNEQYITELQRRLRMQQQTLQQTQCEYNNLKHNFRALQQLYIKQQEQYQQIQQQLQALIDQNKQLKLKTELLNANSNKQTIIKNIQSKSQSQSLKLLQKDEQIITLKRQLNTLEIHKYQLIEQKTYLKNQLQLLNSKYLQQVQKNTEISISYKKDITTYVDQVQRQQQQKTQLIVNNYQTLINKLNQQILLLKQDLNVMKDKLGQLRDKHTKEILNLQNKHNLQLQKLNVQRYERQHDMLKQIQAYQNRVNQEKIILQKSHRVNFDTYLNDEIEARKQLELINLRLQQELNILQAKYKKVLVQKDNVEDQLRENLRKLPLYEQDISFYKDQKDILTKQKQQLYNELQRANTMIMELKKVNNLFEQQRFMFNRQLDDLSVKYTVCIKENENFIDEVKALKKRLTQKQFETENYDSSLRELRIALLQEKQSSEKRLNIIETLKLEIDNHRSKEEYYKMLYEKSQRQIQLMKQQISLLMLEKEKLSLKSSPIKTLSPVKKNTLQVVDQFIETDAIKDRETQLYRIEIYKDLNTLLDLTLQNYTLEQILQKNQQQYLRKLYNAIKEDHDKLLELKQLIVAMQEGFKQQKIHIKQDYDLVYEKYLKYKAMSQAMQKDIEKFKLKLKKKDENFASIKI